MFECPIKYYDNNLIFNQDKSCWASFKIVGYDYENRSIESKIEILNRLTRFIVNFYSEAKILIIPTTQDYNRNFDILNDRLNKEDPLYEIILNQNEQTRKYLTDEEDTNYTSEVSTYVIVKLSDGEIDLVKNVIDMGGYLIKDPVNAINSMLGISRRDILKSEVDYFKKMAKNFFREQNRRISLEYVDKDETNWLFKRMMYRGLNKDLKVRKNWKPHCDIKNISNKKVLSPYSTDIETIFEGKVKFKDRLVTVTHEEGETSYQSFLAVTHITDTMEFPGAEYIYDLQDQDIPTEVCIHINVLTQFASKAKFSISKRTVDSQIKHIEDAGGEVTDDLLDAKDELVDFENELRREKMPLVHASISICIAGSTVDEVEANSKAILDFYKDKEFEVVRPITDQYKLFMSFIPGAGKYVNDFDIPISPRTLAGSIFGASKELGDIIGYYIGTTGVSEKKVLLDMQQATVNNMSAAAIFLGNLGVGKSFNANLLVLLHVLYGAIALIIDPKGERGDWGEALPALKKYITIIRLSSEDKYRGWLDPFVMYKDDIEEACESALNIVSELYKLHPKDDENIALTEALIKIKKEPVRSMSKLAEILSNFKEDDEIAHGARMLGRKLGLLKELGMAKLLFGTGLEEGININNRINILQTENLKLPEKSVKKEDYTQEETLSTIIKSQMSSFAKKLALTKEKNQLLMVLMDEFWTETKTLDGLKLIDFFARMGRSLNTVPIFNGHSVLDIPSEAVKNAITYRFCFRTDNQDEAKRMLEFMNMDVTDENIHIIMNLGNGQCLFQDLNKRVGVLKFDAVFEDIEMAFDTTPKDKNQERGKEQKKKIV